ncbi:MAG: hypothetical protein ACOZAA_04925 [Pseudomonadota bacterium]
MTRAIMLEPFDGGATTPLKIATLSSFFDSAPSIETPPAADPYAEGYEAGRADALNEQSAAVLGLRAAIEEIHRAGRDLDRRYREEAAALIAKVIHAAAPGIALASALAETRRLLFGAARPAPIETVEIRANAAFLAEMKRAIGDDGDSADTLCAFVEDASLADGDLTASWPGGGLSCCAGSAIAAISAFLSSEAGRNDKQENSR